MLGMGMALLAGPKIELFNKAICQQINEEAVMSHPDMPILLLTPEQCRHSIPVQQRLAELNLLLQVIMGVSCMLTTPFWAALSDRIGRKPVIALNAASFVAGDLILVIVLSNPGKIPYLWLLTYPALEGLVAGMAGGQSVMSAYVRRKRDALVAVKADLPLFRSETAPSMVRELVSSPGSWQSYSSALRSPQLSVLS